MPIQHISGIEPKFFTSVQGQVSLAEQLGSVDDLGIKSIDCETVKSLHSLMKVDLDKFHEIASRVIELL